MSENEGHAWGNDWRQIETAPKDRSMLLLADSSGSIQIGFWNGSAWDDGEFHDNMGLMTHWMPLPEPPTTISKAEKV